MPDQIRQFINLVAAGENLQAKDHIHELLSTRAFETLETKKQEIASALFNGKQSEE